VPHRLASGADQIAYVVLAVGVFCVAVAVRVLRAARHARPAPH
jgi:hypothetical protein